MGSGLFGLEERVLGGKAQLAAREALLGSRGLAVPGNEDLILGLYDGEELKATGSLVGDVLQGIAVSDSLEGEGAAASIVSSLLKSAVDRGREQVFLYTSAREGSRFEDLGFSPIASVPGGAALLEWGRKGIASWTASLSAIARDKPDSAGAVVVNCNPFTLGHRKLLEYAAARTPWLYVLVVEENRSLFPFDVRFDLVVRGAADLGNVTVLRGGPYIISSATFPTYFIRPGEQDGARADAAVRLHASLDLAIFRRHVAPALKVTDRFVGTEPYCPTTSVYNETMKQILPGAGWEGSPVSVHEMPRFETGGTAVSASKVRALIRGGKLEEVQALVPVTTWEWLCSAGAEPVLARIRNSDSRH